MKKSISIIIPTYNRQQCLARLLQQLLTQTEIPNQIIVVNDHSTDKTKTVVANLRKEHSVVQLVTNHGHYQRDAKKTGLTYATGQYIGFLDDDIIIKDKNFFAKLQHYLRPDIVVQAKVILENLNKINISQELLIDRFSVRPYPLLEFPGINFHTGSKSRRLYPLIEFGNFWHTSLQKYFIDNNLIEDGYGESYASALRLYRAGIQIQLVPHLIIVHPGSPTGGSQRFDKKSLKVGFTPFHRGYFHNMIYIHARYWPLWVWLWLPYFFVKAIIALMHNRNLAGFKQFALQPITEAVIKFEFKRKYV